MRAWAISMLALSAAAGCAGMGAYSNYQYKTLASKELSGQVSSPGWGHIIKQMEKDGHLPSAADENKYKDDPGKVTRKYPHYYLKLVMLEAKTLFKERLKGGACTCCAITLTDYLDLNKIILEHTQGCKEASITYYEVSLHHTKGTHIKCLNPGWWEWLTDMWVEYSPELWSLVQVVAEIIVITAPVVIGLPLLGI